MNVDIHWTYIYLGLACVPSPINDICIVGRMRTQAAEPIWYWIRYEDNYIGGGYESILTRLYWQHNDTNTGNCKCSGCLNWHSKWPEILQNFVGHFNDAIWPGNHILYNGNHRLEHGEVIKSIVWKGIIIDPCRKSISGISQPPLKLGHGWVMSSDTFTSM